MTCLGQPLKHNSKIYIVKETTGELKWYTEYIYLTERKAGVEEMKNKRGVKT